MESDWYTAVFIKLLWLLVKRLETSPILLGRRGHKCLQGCLCWSLFCSTLGKGRDLMDPQNPLKCCFCDRSADQFSTPRGTNPCSYAPGEDVFFFVFFLKLMVFVFYAGKKRRKICETCWFVLGIHCSTGFEMKTFAYTVNSLPDFLSEGRGGLIAPPPPCLLR